MKKYSKMKKVVLILCLILGIAALAVFFAFKYYFGEMKKTNIDKEELGITEEVSEQYSAKGIKNIAIFGLDGRDQTVDEGRSDSLMVLSVNADKNSLKLISILRDSYVAIDGHGHEKINHAYAYGGPELAIKTLNQNFKLDIQDYVTANFSQFSKVVDSMGGVDIEITSAEMNEINKMTSASSEKLSTYGYVHLNGEQALQYTRIRYIDSDAVRANRQRNVLEALFLKAKKSGLSGSLSLVKSIMPMIETSLSYTDIVGYVKNLFGSDSDLSQMYIPDQNDDPIGGIYEGAWVWRYDIDAAADRLQKFIYE